MEMAEEERRMKNAAIREKQANGCCDVAVTVRFLLAGYID